MNQPDNVLVRVFPVGRYTAEFRDDRGNPSYAIHEGAVPEGVIFSGHFILNFSRVSHGLCLWADTATNRDRCLNLFFEVRADSVTEGVEDAISVIDRRFREECLAEEKAPAQPPGNSLKPDHGHLRDSGSCGLLEGDTMTSRESVLVRVFPYGRFIAEVQYVRGETARVIRGEILPDAVSFTGSFRLYFERVSLGICLWANTVTLQDRHLNLFFEIRADNVTEGVELAIRAIDRRLRETILAEEKATAPPTRHSP